MSFSRSSASRIHVLLLAVAAAACGDSSGPPPNPPASLVILSGNTQTGAAGKSLTNPLIVRVNDGQGAPLGNVAVTFTVAAGNGTLSVATGQSGADGTLSTQWTLGQVAGAEQRVQATVTKPDGTPLTVAFTATALAGPAANILKVSGDLQPGGTGGALADSLVIRVTDEFGNGVPSVSVSWSPQSGTVSPASSITNISGRAATRWTLGDNLGPATITVSAGAIAPASFSATATLSITAISPAELVAGSTVTLTGVGFTPGATANTLTISGAAATVQSATATTITALVPATLPCAPASNVTVALNSGGLRTARAHLAKGAAPRAIAVGEILLGSASDPLTCFELPQDGGRYVIAVTNTNSGGGSSALRLRAASASGMQSTVTLPAANVPGHAVSDPFGLRARRARHSEILERNNQVLGDMLRRSRDLAALRVQPSQQVVPNVGDTLTIRVPRLGLSTSQACATYDSIRARVASVGLKSVALEDVTSPLANAIDTLYQRLVQEFDVRQYDKVKNNFGDPLLLDQQLDNNGRLLMVFTPRVNQTPNVLGFVWTADFFPRSQCQQSNLAEVFYGYVPTVNNQNYGASTIGEWYWSIRATVVHEVKHIAMVAERLTNGSTQYEEAWLEEGLAMLVEELWARDLFGYAQDGNTGYLQSVGCEIRGAIPTGNWPLGPRPECAGLPSVTWFHFGALADWMEVPSTRTMLCRTPSTECPDFSFYGSTWLFLRWLLDQSGQAEDALLRALHTSTQGGIQNLEARFGRSFASLLPEWALAIALDDRAGFNAPSTAYSISSWNLRDVYSGLNQEQPNSYTMPFPLAVMAFTYGNTQFDVPTVRPGAAAFFELSGTPTGRQVLEFSGALGAALDANLRVSIARIQ